MINYKDVVESINKSLAEREDLIPYGLTYLGLYPYDVSRKGNNYPSYIIKFDSEDNDGEISLSKVPTTISMSILLYTRKGDDSFFTKTAIENEIIKCLVKKADYPCPIDNVMFSSVYRGDMQAEPSDYSEGYNENFSTSNISFDVYSCREFLSD